MIKRGLVIFGEEETAKEKKEAMEWMEEQNTE